MRHLFIINPVAGKGRGLKLITDIESLFGQIKEPYKIKITKYPGHGAEIVRKFSEKKEYRIYSVGGDGTLNEVLNGMINSQSSLGIIPCGSGNDLFRTINSNSSMDNILYRTVKGTVKAIDLGRVNDRYFLNISSVGFDAMVAYNSIKIKKFPLVTGSMAYIMGILATVLKNYSARMEITMDSQTINGDFLLAAIANGRYYGGGMLPVPCAKIDDGVFDICLIDSISRRKILTLFPRYIKGTHADIKEVSMYKAKKIVILSYKGLPINIDGEITVLNKVVFEILPASIKVITPL